MPLCLELLSFATFFDFILIPDIYVVLKILILFEVLLFFDTFRTGRS